MKWTNKQIEQLKELWEQGKSDEEIAAIINKSERAVREKRHSLRLVKPFPKRWTNEEIENLRNLYNNYPACVVAEILKRPVEIVRAKAYELHISKSRYNGEISQSGPCREFSSVTDMLIVQFLSEGYSLMRIAAELNRDYDTLKQYCRKHTDRLKAAHEAMMHYDGIYAYKMQNRKEGVL